MIRHIEKHKKIDFNDGIIYDINYNSYHLIDNCKLTSLFLHTTDKVISQHSYSSTTVKHVLSERTLKNDILYVKLRSESKLKTVEMRNDYVYCKQAIIYCYE